MRVIKGQGAGLKEGMMRAVAMMILLASPAVAEDWVLVLDDAGVTAALAGRTLIYDAYTQQTFGPDGDTTYITERASDGRWAARAGQYCSVWPPSDIWACYDLHLSGERVKFIGSDRSESIGTYAK